MTPAQALGVIEKALAASLGKASSKEEQDVACEICSLSFAADLRTPGAPGVMNAARSQRFHPWLSSLSGRQAGTHRQRDGFSHTADRQSDRLLFQTAGRGSSDRMSSISCGRFRAVTEGVQFEMPRRWRHRPACGDSGRPAAEGGLRGRRPDGNSADRRE